MLKLIETTRTTCTPYQLTQSFVEAWQTLYGQLPKKQQIAILYAQNALETGSSTQMWNWNIGNCKAVDIAGQTIEYCILNGVFEYVNGVRVNIPPTSPAAWFRSFPTLTAGVTFYFDLLKNHRYRNAWTAVENGDPQQFCHLLRVAGYYTAPESAYVAAEMAYFNKFMASDYFETALKTLNPQADIPQPTVAPGIDLPQPELNGNPQDDGPLTLTPWQKATSWITNPFKK